MSKGNDDVRLLGGKPAKRIKRRGDGMETKAFIEALESGGYKNIETQPDEYNHILRTFILGGRTLKPTDATLIEIATTRKPTARVEISRLYAGFTLWKIII